MRLGIYAVSLAFFARYMPASTRESRLWRGYVATVVIAILGEVVWLSGAAMQNTASHFNTTVPLFTALYPLMGAFAVLLTSASLTMGISILRNKDTALPPALHLSIALGLILTFAATVPVAGYLSSAGSHFVGPSSRQMWLLAWSRDAGDLRVAHFLATHALHFVPLAGLLATRLLSPRWAAACCPVGIDCLCRPDCSHLPAGPAGPPLPSVAWLIQFAFPSPHRALHTPQTLQDTRDADGKELQPSRG